MVISTETRVLSVSPHLCLLPRTFTTFTFLMGRVSLSSSHQTSTLEFLLFYKFLACTYSLCTYNLSFLYFIRFLTMCFRGCIPVTSLVHWAFTSSAGLRMVSPRLPNTCLLATALIFLCFPFLILCSIENLKLTVCINFSPNFNAHSAN